MYSASAVCEAKGYKGEHSMLLPSGKVLTDRDIAGMVADAMGRHESELPEVPPLPMGADEKTYKRAVKEREKAIKKRMEVADRLVKEDVLNQVGIEPKWWMFGIVAAAALLIFGGPVLLLISVMSGAVEWFVKQKLDDMDKS